MEINSQIFRAYDIRGIVENELTEDAVRLIGQAIGTEAQAQGEDTIIIARDGRLSGPVLLSALSDGITKSGCDVINIGDVPTPILYFATETLDSRSGVMLTGSHNPPNYNGLKMVIANTTLSHETIQKLYQRIINDDLISGEGSVQHMDMVEQYLDHICEDVKLPRPLNIVIDCGNGIAGKVAPMLFQRLGCQVTKLYCEVDGTFPNHHPDPSQADTLKDLIHSVKTQKADIGLAFDGDGDRLGVVTNTGEIIWPDRYLILCAIDVLSRNKNAKIIYDVKCTNHVAKMVEKHHGKPIMCRTGHSFVKAAMKETGAVLGGEMSGHTFFKERWFGFDDALYSAARLLEILAKQAKTTDEVFAEIPNSVNTPELKLPIDEAEKFKFIDSFQKEALFDGATITTIDGLRADFNDGWGLVRASNTTPVLVLRFEANSKEALQNIQEQFRRELLKLNSKLQLPF